jgi:hypothetical protein
MEKRKNGKGQIMLWQQPYILLVSRTGIVIRITLQMYETLGSQSSVEEG